MLSEADKFNASTALDNHPRLEQILDASSAIDVRDKILDEYDINPNAPISPLQSAILAEAVRRWNKLHPVEPSAE